MVLCIGFISKGYPILEMLSFPAPYELIGVVTLLDPFRRKAFGDGGRIGSGITSGLLLTYRDLEKRVVVELFPAVVEAASSFHSNFALTHHPWLTG